MSRKHPQKKDSETTYRNSEMDATYVLAHIAHWYLLFAVIVGGLFAAYVLTRGIV